MVRLITALGAFIVLLFATTHAVAKDSEWVEAETPNFIVTCRCSETTAVERARRLETFHATLLRFVRQSASQAQTPKLRVYLVKSRLEFRDVLSDMKSGTGAFYFANAEMIAGFAPLPSSENLDAEVNLFHLYAHHFMLQHMSGYFPPWYVEGFADFVELASLKEQNVEVGHISFDSANLVDSRWLDLRTVLTAHPNDINAKDARMYRALSWLLTHYVNVDPAAKQAFGVYPREVRSGADPVAAFEAAFEQSIDEVTASLRAYVRAPLNRLAFPIGASIAADAVQVRRLERSADDLVLLEAALMRLTPGAAGGQKVLADIRTKAAAYPGDRRATLLLARAEAFFGSRQTARDLLAPLVQANPNDRDAYYLSGLAWFLEAKAAPVRDEEKFTQARRAFVRANRIEPDNYATLYRYVQTSVTGRAQMSPELLSALVRAADLAPQVGEISAFAGVSLALAGRRDEAIAILRPIAAYPHGAGHARLARSVLKSLEDGTDPVDAFEALSGISADEPEAP